MSQAMDPMIQQELVTKKQYVEKMKSQIKQLRQENEAIASQHFSM